MSPNLRRGIEEDDDLAVIREIGITLVQRYLLGRPMPLAAPRDLPLARGA